MPYLEQILREDIQLRQEKSGDIFFWNRSPHRILGVNKISQANFAALAQHHVGIVAFKIKISLKPIDQFAIGNSTRTFQRPGTTNRHDEVICFQARPLDIIIFSHINSKGSEGWIFNSDPTNLSISLTSVSV